jgi:ADP-ribosylglycohydrolase
MNIAVYRAANLGGDSDSVASIVAAMSVCATGDLYKEQDEIQYVQGVDVLRSISQELSFMVPGNERGGRR